MSAERWAARPEALREVSEWAAQELVVALSIGTEAAELLLTRSLTLVHRLPGPSRRWRPARCTRGTCGRCSRRSRHRERHRPGGGGGEPAPLGRRPGDDPGAARRQGASRGGPPRRACRGAEAGEGDRPTGCAVAAGPVDGMATVTALLTQPEALVFLKALGAFADAVPDDPENPRTRDQKMADCLMDLVSVPASRTGSRYRCCSRSWRRWARWPGATRRARSTAMSCRPRRSVLCSPSRPVDAVAVPLPRWSRPSTTVASGTGDSAADRSGPRGWEEDLEDLESLWAETERWTLADFLGTRRRPIGPDPETARWRTPGGEPRPRSPDFRIARR